MQCLAAMEDAAIEEFSVTLMRAKDTGNRAVQRDRG
jgi:hypothetical protein